MPGTNDRVAVQSENSLTDALEHEIAIRTPEVCPPHASLKKGIARQKGFARACRAILLEAQAEASRAVPRRMDHRKAQVPELDLLLVLEKMIHWKGLLIAQAEKFALHLKIQIKGL